MAEKKKKEEIPEEEKGKGYTYEFYHEIGKKGGEERKRELGGSEGYRELGHKGGETVKKRHGHETLEEVQREHEEGKP